MEIKETEPKGIWGKRDWLFCILLIGTALTLITVITPEHSLFGSRTDWISQHSVFPEYFRCQYVQTGSLFPDFAMELGGGQNIYQFSYYGLYNPIILPAYLLPDVPMTDYLETASAASAVCSAVLFFVWVRGKGIGSVSAFLASFCFLTAAPLLFHFHRHVMFVNYMPFLLLAFCAMDRCGRKGWHAVFFTGVACCILTSYFFSPGCLAALFLYGLTELQGQPPAERRRKYGRLLALGALAVLSAAFLWLPTGLALLSGRETGAGMADLSAAAKQFIPTLQPQWLLGGPYTLGLTWIAAVALVYALTAFRGRRRLLPAGLVLLLLVPGLTWLLCGTLYTRPKALIPFLPLYCLVTAYLLQRICEWAGASGRLTVRRWAEKLGYGLLITAVAGSSLLSCIGANQGENWVTEKEMDKLQASAKAELLTHREKAPWFRTDDLPRSSFTVNETYSASALRTSIYSSVFNQDYSRFCSEWMGNAVLTRNPMIGACTKNLFFQAFMGVRYLISKDGAPGGYKKTASREGLILYENQKVLPLGWATARTCSFAYLKNRDLSERIQMFFESIAVDQSTGSQQEVLEESWFYPLSESKQRELLGNEVFPVVSLGETVNVPFAKPLSNTVLLIEFNVTDRGTPADQDIAISINGIQNKLSGKAATYPNGNTHFTYVISSHAPMEALTVKFGEGMYELSDVKMYVMEEARLWKAIDRLDRFEVSQSQCKANRIEGSIQVTEDGWFAVSIPYDRGFQVTVDGRPQDYSRVNGAFLGFPIEKGDHNIVLVYHAPGKRMGIVLSLLGLGIGVLIMFLWRRGERA